MHNASSKYIYHFNIYMYIIFYICIVNIFSICMYAWLIIFNFFLSILVSFLLKCKLMITLKIQCRQLDLSISSVNCGEFKKSAKHIKSLKFCNVLRFEKVTFKYKSTRWKIEFEYWIYVNVSEYEFLGCTVQINR